MAWGGQFGTPGFASGDVPMSMIKQYPGAQNFRQSMGMYGNLLYGPYSRAPQISGAQATDPGAQQFQQEGEYGGGAFAPPGEGTQSLSNLFGSQVQGNVAEQQAQTKQQGQAGQGMLDTLNKYAQDMYDTQTAANTLKEAQAKQQEEQQGAIIDLGAMLATVATGNPLFMQGAGVLTNNQGMVTGANAFSQVGGPQSSGMSGGLFSNWLGPSSAQQFYPTSGSFGTIDPGGAMSPDAGYFSGTGIDEAYMGNPSGDMMAYNPGMFASAAGGGAAGGF